MSVIQDRQHWMSVLAKSVCQDLEDFFAKLDNPPNYVFLRKPEIGLALVRGRMGGTGRRFNLGELTLTRCTVQTDSGIIGHGYVLGRKPRQAQLAAIFDALFQDADQQEPFLEGMLAALEDSLRQKQEQISRESDTSRVNFFTLVRGEDQ